jgi:hypothetical protein
MAIPGPAPKDGLVCLGSIVEIRFILTIMDIGRQTVKTYLHFRF